MRRYTAQLAKDVLRIGEVLIEYKLLLLMVEVFLHVFVAIVAKQHQFDVMEVSI